MSDDRPSMVSLLRSALPCVEHMRDEAIRLGTKHDRMDKLICDIIVAIERDREVAEKERQP